MRAHAEDGAKVVETLSAAAAARLLAGIPAEVAAQVAQRMGLAPAVACLERMRPSPAAELLAAMEPDQAAILTRRIAVAARRAILRAMAADRRELLTHLLAYPEGTAGALMDVDLLALPHETLVGQAWEQVKATAQRAIYYVYVVQRSRLLVGVLNLKELATAPPDRQLRTVMVTDVVTLPPDLTVPALIAHSGWLDFHALPVIDDRGRFLGVIRHETVRRLELEYVSRRGTTVPDVGLALGELYWVGLSKFTEGIARGLLGEPGKKPPKEG
jgi:magnesium transporter